MSNGSLDWLGAEQNLTILEGSTRLHLLEFKDTGSGEAMDLRGVTFDGLVTAADGKETGIEVAEDELNVGRLKVTFPVLAAGVYRYELRAVDNSGEKRRVVWGQLGVLSTSLELGSDVLEGAEQLRLLVKVPGRDARRIMLEWQASTWAELMMEKTKEYMDKTEAFLAEAIEQAKKAEEAAERAKDIADKMEERLQEVEDRLMDEFEREMGELRAEMEEAARKAAAAADEAAERAKEWAEEAKRAAEEAVKDTQERIDELIEAVEETQRWADETVERLEVFLYKFEEKIQSVVWVDPETGHLFVGGMDTGAKVTGEPGKSPYVNEDGDWMYYDDRDGAWKNGGKARGEDGFSPYLDAEGFMVYRDPETGELRVSTESMHGRDGIDGTTVRRILVEEEKDIPNEGETCNGGFYYYVENRDIMPRAIIQVLSTGRTAGDTMKVDGHAVKLPAESTAPAAAATELGGTIKAVCDYLEVKVEGDKVLLRSNNITLTVDRSGVGYGVIEVPMCDEAGYRIFAWLEQGGGKAGWVQVGMANDIATQEIYGLVKLGTDMQIEGGAAVGTNEAGEMRVPEAELMASGTVKVSEAAVVKEGGKVGKNATGQLQVPLANRDAAGAVKPSYAGAEELSWSVGIGEGGKLGVPWASQESAGVVRLGGAYDAAEMPRPYRLDVGATGENHTLGNNLLVTGALQKQKWSEWKYKMPDRAPEGTAMVEESEYLGLHTTEQFAQTEHEGLALLGATDKLLGGVYVVADLDDRRVSAVPGVGGVKKWLEKNYWSRTDMEVGGSGEWFVAMSDWLHKEFYTKTQIDEEVVARLKEWVKVECYVKGETEELPIWGKMQDYIAEYAYSKAESDQRLEARVTQMKGVIDQTLAAMQKTLNEGLASSWKKADGEKWVLDQLKPYELTEQLLKRGYDTVEHVNALDKENVKATPGLKRIYVQSPDEFEASRGSRAKDALYIKATI